MGAARDALTLETLLADFMQRFQIIESNLRDRRGFSSTETKPIGTSSGSSSAGITGFLKDSGDQMVGPIGFAPSINTVVDGEIDVSKELNLSYTSYVLLNSEGAPADTLDTIKGAAFPGQIITFQIVNAAITFSNVGNIQGNDVEIQPGNTISFIFDAFVNQQWKLWSGSAGGGGAFLPIAGGTMIGPIAYNPVLVPVDPDGRVPITSSSMQTIGLSPPTDVYFFDGALFNGQQLEYQVVNQNSQVIKNAVLKSISDIRGVGGQIVRVTIDDTSLLVNGDKVNITSTTNFNLNNATIIVTGATTFTYDLGTPASLTPESNGIVQRGNIVMPDDQDLILDSTITPLGTAIANFSFDNTILGGGWRLNSSTVSSAGSVGYDTIQDEGTPVTQRAIMNFIGAGVQVVDNPGQNRSEITITTGAINWKIPVRAKSDGFTATFPNIQQVIDGVTLVQNDRVLLTDELFGKNNGIWKVNGPFTGNPLLAPLIRPDDFNSTSDMISETFVAVEEGTNNKETLWHLVTPNPIFDNVTSQSWLLFGTGSPLTTKGDILGFSTQNARIPVGSPGLPLVANSSEALGVKYEALKIEGGGTGQSAYTKGDLLFGQAGGSFLGKLGIGSTDQILRVNAAGDLPEWGIIKKLTQIGDVSDLLTPAATNVLTWNGSSWGPQAAPGGNPLTTAGDLLTRNATVEVRLPVGTVNDQVLTVKLTDPNKIIWQTLIASQIPGLSANKIISGQISPQRGGTGASINPVAVGDLLVGLNATTFQTLSVGAAAQFLKGGTTPSWSTIALTNLSDVNLTTPTSGNIIAFSGGGIWVNQNISATQIPDLPASKITSGIFPILRGGTGLSLFTKGDLLYGPTSGTNLSKLGIGTTDQILRVSSGGVPEWSIIKKLNQIGDVTATNDPPTGNFLVWNGSSWINQALSAIQIPDLPASKITSGTFTDARIPNLAASKITSGTFADARIPNLAASKITSGIFPVARGGTGNAASTQGDMLYAATTNAWTRLPKGLAGQILEMGPSNIPQWGIINNLSQIGDVSANVPIATNVLTWNGSQWQPQAAPGGSLEGVQDERIWIDQQTTEFNFNVFLSNAKDGSNLFNSNIALDKQYYVPIWIAKTVRLREIGFDVATAVGLNTVTFAIYDSHPNQNYPKSKIIQNTGTNVVANGTGIRTRLFFNILTPGLYWLSFRSSVAISIKYHLIENANIVGWKPALITTGAMSPIAGFESDLTSSTLPSTPDNSMAISPTIVPALFALFDIAP